MNNTIRFSGLASGLDTQSIVKALAQPYQNKVDTAKQDKVLMEWRKDLYKQTTNKINTFKTQYIDKMRLQATFSKTKVSVSNPNAISMDPNVPVPSGNHTIKVETMAQGAVASTSTIKKTDNTPIDKSKTTIGELMPGMSADDVFEVTIGGKSVKITKDTDLDGKGTKKEISKMTIEEFESEVQKQLGSDKECFKFDDKVNAFIIATKETGQNQKIDFAGSSTDLLQALKIGTLKSDGSVEAPKTPIIGSDAKIQYNGGVTVTSATNNIEINGLKFNITGTSSETISISSVKDTDGIVSFAKEFVEGYNKLLEEVNTLISADSAKGYKPLTDEERKAMSDKEIELWEKKIKDGLLRNDPMLKDITGMMREALGKDYGKDKGPLDGNKYTMLGSIGITTGNWSERGKLHLDEEKLRKAINEDSDSVTKLFNQVGGEIYGTTGDTTTPATGFQALLKSNDLKSYGQFFNDKLLDENIRKMGDTIKKAEIKYSKIENMYYKQFTAMEKMLNGLNSQSSWLSSMGGM